MESGETLKDKIRKAGLKDTDIEARIEEKKHEFGGLLSEEGILTIIATELGILSSPQTSISELKEGEEATIQARVTGVTSVREFVRPDSSTGRVATVFLSDSTGDIPLTLWDEECMILDNLKRGDAVKIIGGSVRSGQRGFQIYLGKGRLLTVPAGEGEVSSPAPARPPARRIRLGDVSEAKGVEVRGTIAKLYPLRIYEACPDCFKSVTLRNNEYFCGNCSKKVIARHVMIAEVGVDDCTGYIRATFFDRRAERLLGVETREANFEIREMAKRLGDKKEAGLRYMFEHHHAILGQEVVVEGEIIASEYSGHVMRAYDFRTPDVREEALRILEGFT
jgi:ssDNA-binding replication factor A large subunit